MRLQKKLFVWIIIEYYHKSYLLPSWDRTPSLSRKYCSPSDVYLSRRDIGSKLSTIQCEWQTTEEVKVNNLPTETLANILHETCSNIKEIVGINNGIDSHSILQPILFTTCTISNAICLNIQTYEIEHTQFFGATLMWSEHNLHIFYFVNAWLWSDTFESNTDYY